MDLKKYRNSKELINLLKENGWEYVRTRGSHSIFKKNGVSLPVPHPKKDLPIGTVRSILKVAGLILVS